MIYLFLFQGNYEVWEEDWEEPWSCWVGPHIGVWARLIRIDRLWWSLCTLSSWIPEDLDLKCLYFCLQNHWNKKLCVKADTDWSFTKFRTSIKMFFRKVLLILNSHSLIGFLLSTLRSLASSIFFCFFLWLESVPKWGFTSFIKRIVDRSVWWNCSIKTESSTYQILEVDRSRFLCRSSITRSTFNKFYNVVIYSDKTT